MLKFENVAEVGEVIKALDFRPMADRPDNYIVGRVIAKGDMGMCEGYKVVVLNSETGCEEYDVKRIATEMIVPFEMSMLEHDTRVTKLTD